MSKSGSGWQKNGSRAASATAGAALAIVLAACQSGASPVAATTGTAKHRPAGQASPAKAKRGPCATPGASAAMNPEPPSTPGHSALGASSQPPVLIPGRLAGPAPAGAGLHLVLVLKSSSPRVAAEVRRAAAALGLAVTGTDTGSGTSHGPAQVHVRGTVAQVEAAFQVCLVAYRSADGRVLGAVPTAPPRIPASMTAGVASVRGFYAPAHRSVGGRRLG